MSVPLVDGGLVAGSVVFDRQRARPFESADEKKAQGIADEVSRAVETERIISVLDEERREKTRVFTAARAFGGVVREEEAAVVALSTSLKIAPLDAAAFLRVCPDESLELLQVAGPKKDILNTDELIACDPETWVGRAIRQGTLLPHVCVNTRALSAVFTRAATSARAGLKIFA